MKTRTVIVCASLTALLLTPVGTTAAVDAVTDQAGAGYEDGLVSLIIGRVAQVNGQAFIVEEDGGGSVQVQITPDTRGAKTVAVDQQVLVSLLPSGVASVITSGTTAADGEPLFVGEPGTR